MKKPDSIEQKLRELDILVEPKESLLSGISSRLPSWLKPIKYYDVRVTIRVEGSYVYAYSNGKYIGIIEGNSGPIKNFNGKTITFRSEVQDWTDYLRFLPYLP